MTHLLSETRLTGEQTTYVEAIGHSGQALLGLIEDLLDFARIEADRFELDPAPADIRDLVAGVVELMAARAHERGLAIACRTALDVPRRIVVDAARLRQVLLNLVANAVKFTERGGVGIETLRCGERLQIQVRDTGPGLDRNDHARIFTEFEQAETGRDRTHGGAGLGLAIAHRIVSAMGGSILLESAPGEGSCFTVDIPLIAAGGEAAPAKDDALAGRSVLILSPHASEAEVLCRTIRERGGHAVPLSAPDGISEHLSREAQAGHAVTDLIVDAELVDEVPPHIGLGLAAGSWSCRRIVLMAPADRGRLDGLREEGFDGWLMRPVRSETLVKVLAQGLTVPEDEQPGQPDTVPTLPPIELPAASPGRLRVLVAEDNQINALLMRMVLVGRGHDVTLVTDGQALAEAAVAAVEADGRGFDLIITDLDMPRLDGPGAIRTIRGSADPRLQTVPIIVLTADGQAETRDLAHRVGADAYVTKPVDPPMLLETAERLTAGRGQAETAAG